MLSAEDRAQRRRARELLKTGVVILKRAGVTQNEIARQAEYTTGYMPQLLKEDASGERLTPVAITRLTTAMGVLSAEAMLRLDEGARLELRQILDTLKAGYGETRHEVIGPGEALTASAANYVHRRTDNLLAQEIVRHRDFTVIGLVGPPGAGKSWAVQKASLTAAETHEVCTIDLRDFLDEGDDQAGSKDDWVARLALDGLQRRLRWLRSQRQNENGGETSTFEKPSGHVRATDLGGVLQELAAVATRPSTSALASERPPKERVLVVIDEADRAGDATRLIGLLRQVQTNSWEYPGLERVMILVVGTVLRTSNTDLQSSMLKPVYPLGYLLPGEVQKLVEMWQAAGELRDLEWSAIEPELSTMAGHPMLVSQYLECCRIEGQLATASKMLQPGGVGWTFLTRQIARFGEACARGGVERANDTISRWLEVGTVDISDTDDLNLPALVRDFGLVTGSGDWQPFLAEAKVGNGPFQRVFVEALDRSRVTSSGVVS